MVPRGSAPPAKRQHRSHDTNQPEIQTGILLYVWHSVKACEIPLGRRTSPTIPQPHHAVVKHMAYMHMCHHLHRSGAWAWAWGKHREQRRPPHTLTHRSAVGTCKLKEAETVPLHAAARKTDRLISIRTTRLISGTFTMPYRTSFLANRARSSRTPKLHATHWSVDAYTRAVYRRSYAYCRSSSAAT